MSTELERFSNQVAAVQADGGCDTPESANEALHVAVQQSAASLFRVCRFETMHAGRGRHPSPISAQLSPKTGNRTTRKLAGTFRALWPVVQKKNDANRTRATAPNLPASKKPGASRPMSSRVPVAARVDVVVANLECDPRRK
jgi:hypothetical protein